MSIVWNEQSIKWFQNASEFTGYNKKLADILLKHIPSRKTLCDVGCGAGLVDFELAPSFEQITCVDISQDAVDSVEKMANRLGVKNISTVCMDVGKLYGKWDTVIALFNDSTVFFPRYFHLAKDRLILVTRGNRKGNFCPEKHKVIKGFDVSSLKAQLDKMGVKYTQQEIVLEHGQPATDLMDAAAFVQMYSTPMHKYELDSYLEQHLINTGNEKFPYYLPNLKKIGIFVIRIDENKNTMKSWYERQNSAGTCSPINVSV